MASYTPPGLTEDALYRAHLRTMPMAEIGEALRLISWSLAVVRRPNARARLLIEREYLGIELERREWCCDD